MILHDQLKYEEGLRLKKYRCTAGRWTIGYGHNLDANPLTDDGERIPDTISAAFAEELLRADVAEAIAALEAAWPRVIEFDPARRDAFVNMAFQLGVGGLMQFKAMRAAAIARDWETAARQAIKSRWAKQTPERARRVAEQIRSGKYYKILSDSRTR